MKKRLLSAFLAVMMVLTMAPVAFAADGETTSEPVAQVDGTDYATLAEAIAAADGKTLTLLKDVNGQIVIPEGKTVTLDLNGNTVTAPSGRYDAVINQGTLTVTDSQKTGEIISNGNGGIGISAGSDTTIEYAKVTGREGAIGGDKSTVGAKLTINDGVFTGVDNAVVIFNGSKRDGDANKITINGGIFNGKIQSSGYVACGIYAPWKDDITVNNGTFNIENGAGIVARGGMVTVKGGEFNTTGNITGMVGDYKGTVPCSALVFDSTAGYPGMDDDSQIVVEDGKFKSDVAAVTVIKQTSDAGNRVKVSGGTFSSDVSAYVAEGYVQNANGTVKQLGETNAVAKIGNTYYKSLVDAYAALPRGEGAAPSESTTITLLKDSEGGGIGSDKTDNYMNYVIDFNGHTYTVGAPAVGSTGTVSQGIRVLKTSTAKFMNGTLKAANYKDLIQVVHTYGDVTFQDFTVDATEDAYAWAAVEPDAGTLKVLGNSSILARKGQYGLYAAFWHAGSYDGTTVDVDTTGKITGKLAYEFDEDYTGENKATKNKGFVNIKNGNFDILSIQEIWSDVSDAVDKNVGGIIISGGYFTVDPSGYLAVSAETGKKYVAGAINESPYFFRVALVEDNQIPVVPAVGETAAPSAKELEKTGMTKEAAEAVAAAAKKVAAGDTEIKEAVAPIATGITDEKAEKYQQAAANDVDAVEKIEVRAYLEVKPTAYNGSAYTLDITPKYDVVVVGTKNGATAKKVVETNTLNVTKATEVSVQLPAGFVTNTDNLYVQHKGHEYDAAVTANNGVYTANFTNPHGFSPFTISKTPQTVATIGTDKYTSFADAVSAVPANGTIEITGGTSPYTGTANKTFTVKNSKSADITVNGQTIKSNESYTFKYTHSSGGSSGGSSSGKTTYKVTTSAVNNGGVNASPSNAEKGAAITITLSPDKGYKLDKLTVTDGSGKTVSTVKKSDTVYTFTMPASAVNVGVSYVKATETPSETKFNDVSANDWFASAVDYVTGKGMMNGTADNTFSPKANTTRGMVVTVLYRLENQPSTSAASFTDVASGAYYANAVAWANANGIVSGYGSGKFGPNDKVTREQLAAILYRYAQYKKYDVSVGEDTNILSYDDAQSISSYAIPAIQWACGAGVVTGKSGSKLDPKGNATRAEVAAMLMRFCENVK